MGVTENWPAVRPADVTASAAATAPAFCGPAVHSGDTAAPSGEMPGAAKSAAVAVCVPARGSNETPANSADCAPAYSNPTKSTPSVTASSRRRTADADFRSSMARSGAARLVEKRDPWSPNSVLPFVMSKFLFLTCVHPAFRNVTDARETHRISRNRSRHRRNYCRCTPTITAILEHNLAFQPSPFYASIPFLSTQPKIGIA